MTDCYLERWRMFVPKSVHTAYYRLSRLFIAHPDRLTVLAQLKIIFLADDSLSWREYVTRTLAWYDRSIGRSPFSSGKSNPV